MSDGDDLYRAILDNPDDDAPRLVYADWLDEHGRPERADFIRVQCAMARLPAETGRWKGLLDRAQRLEREWRGDWTRPAQARVLDARLGRGFVDSVRLTVEQFVAGAEELVRAEPVRCWEFAPPSMFSGRPAFTRLAADPSLTVIRTLNAGRYLADELLRTLSESRYLSALRALIVPNRAPTAQAVVALVEQATRLDEIELDDANYGVVRDLWKWGAQVRFRKLSLVRSYVTDAVVRQLAGSPALARLETLRVDANDVTDRGAKAVAETEHLLGLRELSLAGCPIGDVGAMALARSPALAGLRVLNLSDCQIDSAGAQALADSPYLDGLECLCLDDNRVSVGVETELSRRFGPGVCSVEWNP